MTRRLVGSAVRGLIEAQNAVWFSTSVFASTPRDGSIVLSICIVPGMHRSIFIRAVTALLDDLPSDAEVLVTDHGVARHAKRVLSDYLEVRYVPSNTAEGRIGASMNELARAARGSHLLFIAPDTIASPQIVVRAMQLLHNQDTAPAVTGSVVDHAGLFIESGSGIGGTGDMPTRRDEQFRTLGRHEQKRASFGASRAAALIDRRLFEFVGGCDEQATQTALGMLCERMVSAGARIDFDPGLAIIDLKGFSSAEHRRRSLRERRRSQPTPTSSGGTWRHGENIAANDSEPLQILLIEGRVPHPELGQGYPRSHRLLRELDRAGQRLVLYPLQDPAESVPSAYRDIPRHIAILLNTGKSGLHGLLNQHGREFDLIIVARPDNMRVFREARSRLPAAAVEALPPVVYDAEAISASRDVLRSIVLGAPMPEDEAEELIGREVALAADCDLVVAVSENERAEFERRGVKRVVTLGHAVDLRPGEAPFHSRSGFLFVGALLDARTPNGDGLLWFVNHVWSIIRERLASASPRLVVAGKISNELRAALSDASIDVLGTVGDLAPLYDRTRVFVSPARFSSGIPLKVLDASRHGVPVVATSQAATQLGWVDGEDLLTADDPTCFATQCQRLHEEGALWDSLRSGALKKVEAQASEELFKRRVDEIIRVGRASRR